MSARDVRGGITVILVLLAVMWLAGYLSNVVAPTRGTGVNGSSDSEPKDATAVVSSDPGVPAPVSRPTPTHATRSRSFAAYTLDVTAYTYTGHPTASGRWPRPGYVASDLFPLGTRLLIPGVGEVVVMDRVGCCTDVDVFMPSRQAAVRWGRKRLRVVVL